MSNVLPQSEKKRILRTIRARYLIVGSLALLSGAVVASLSLLPAIISIRIAQDSLDSSAAQLRDDADGDYAIQVRTQGLLDTFTPIVSATTSPTDLLQAALAVKPPGISVTSMSFSGGAKGSIVLSGVARDRLAVNAFSEALQRTEKFGTVTVPVASLVGTQDGRFTVTLSNFK